ncbi:response regulator [Beijerinckia sp. L45]|uniref:response regulator n=1 Tax=Beijerinckia sp. L45 TaxID=1641855 RepID=UPI00131D6540|nr:response regulator [Beijerinckia sp. L45]
MPDPSDDAQTLAQRLEAEQTRSDALSRATEELASAQSETHVVDVLRRCARALCRADGVAVILRDGETCRYVAGDAVGPLWTGQSFPMDSCISGWAMTHGRTAVIADITADERIPQDLYRDSFVKSLVMTPVGFDRPSAALGIYWAKTGTPEPASVKAVEQLARTASVALRNVALYESLASEAKRSAALLDQATSELADRRQAEAALRQAEAELRHLNETLEERVAERTEELAASNRQLVSQFEERERVAETLRQMQRLEAVGQLTSGVAHDFNNLLTVILGNLAFIQRGVVGTPMEQKLLRRLGFMESAAERGAKLTAQLLAFSRRQRLEPKPIDLNASVDGLRDLLQSTMGGAVRIETVLSPQLWPALVDPTQIELVILNLAINARDAMAVGGSVTVETSNVVLRERPRSPEEPEPGDYVAVAVRDNGFGMTDEVRAKAFEPFFTTKDIGHGTGLGLSQVLGFAKQSGGGVRIDSKVGEGTTVWVFLPRATRDLISDQAPAPYDRDGVTFAGATILLVDDDGGVREVTAAMLREAGYAVVEAGSGGAGLEALDRTEQVDLLLVDFAMPGMNGAEVAREASIRRPGLPILFVTGYADLDVIRSVGEERIIAKPFQFDRLLLAIDRALGGKLEPFAELEASANVVRLRR